MSKVAYFKLVIYFFGEKRQVFWIQKRAVRLNLKKKRSLIILVKIKIKEQITCRINGKPTFACKRCVYRHICIRNSKKNQNMWIKNKP